jgi:hypothetical protein
MYVKHHGLVPFIAVAVWTAALASARAEGTGVPLDQLLSDVQQVLIKVRDAADGESLPVLASVNLVLRTSLVKQADGSIKVVILDAGANISDETVQEIRLTLQPPRRSDKSPVAGSVKPLADAIIDAARSVKRAANRDPPLHLVKLEASIAFTVEKEVGVSAGFRILPITIDLGGKAKGTNVQQINLIFGEKS